MSEKELVNEKGHSLPELKAYLGIRSHHTFLKGEYSGLEAHTFLGRDSVEAIKNYLDWRKRVKHEQLTDDSYLFHCEICVYGPAKRRFMTYGCRKCIEQAERLVHSIVPDENYISNPEKLDHWLMRRSSSPPESSA